MATFQSQINILASTLTSLYDETHAFSSSIATNAESVKILERKKHFDDNVNIQPYSKLTDEAKDLLNVNKDSEKSDTYSNFLLQAIQNGNYGYGESQVNRNKIQELSSRIYMLENNPSSSSGASVNYIGDYNIKSNGDSLKFVDGVTHDTHQFKTLNDVLEFILPFIENLNVTLNELSYDFYSTEH